MPKPHTFPTLYNDVHKLEISKFKEWDYLNPDSFKSGTLTWTRNGTKTGAISVSVNTYDSAPIMLLDYTYRDKPKKYQVRLVSVPSNLGKGVVWYFLCPHTLKRCRKLYCVGGEFLHREAFKGCMYESQTYSHKTRDLMKLFDSVTGYQEAMNELDSKHFTKFYSGQPTKGYKKAMDQLKRCAGYSHIDIEQLYLM
jgi:hypothetical protein